MLLIDPEETEQHAGTAREVPRPPDALACVPGAIVRFDGAARAFSRMDFGSTSGTSDAAPDPVPRRGDACALSADAAGPLVATARATGDRARIVVSRYVRVGDSPRIVAMGEADLPATFGSRPLIVGDAGVLGGVNGSRDKALEGSFIVLSPRGHVARVTLDGSGSPSVLLGDAPAGSALGDHTSLSFRNGTLLRAGDEGVWRVAIGNPSTPAPSPTVSVRAERLPVSPCAEKEMCGTSLAPDGSWLVCGTWGCSLGKGNARARVALPALGEEKGAMAVAHSGASGRYVLLGPNDGDAGGLPGLPREMGADTAGRAVAFAPVRDDARRAVWTQPRHATVLQALEEARTSEGGLVPLFPYWIEDRSGVRRYGAVAIAPRTVVEGASGDNDGNGSSRIVAWEAAALHDAPTPLAGPERALLPSRNTGSREDAGLWWRDSLRLDALTATLASAPRAPGPIKVGVVDSGVDLSHPALAAVLAPERWDFVEEDDTPEDQFGHGTHVAALIASRDPRGIAGAFPAAPRPLGVAANASLVIARALDRSGKSNSLDLARALAFVHESGARAVNCSWGGGPETQVLRDAFTWLVEEGLFVASSAGNDALDLDASPQVPKNFSGVVNTGAADERGARARFSNRGRRSVFLFAPGTDILSALPGGTLGFKSGTSMASPLTTGTAAILLGLGLDTEQAKDVLCRTARPGPLSRDARCGVLDPLAAVEAALAEAP